MHPLILFVIVASFSNIFENNTVKALTESMGQEVIEIGNPIKELPAGLEEEPSIENEEDEHSTTSFATPRPPTVKKENRKANTVQVATIHENKLPPNILEQTEDEEDRIEKELADMYKDNIDYKESSESTIKAVTTKAKNVTANSTDDTDDPMKPIGRAKGKSDFIFQPNPFNKAEIERFRTSVDDISCIQRLKQESDDTKAKTDAACSVTLHIPVLINCLLMKTLF